MVKKNGDKQQDDTVGTVGGMQVNVKYKDRLFRALFGSESQKENLLSLYNALNGTSYDDLDELEINIIDDVIYMGMKNDVSCIIDGNLSLYEHQSTFNPNMPLRGILYFGKMYSKIVGKGYNIYSNRLIKIPTPQYYVFYNGNDEMPDRLELKLSDAFEQPVKEGTYEWTAIMLNINYGRNKKLMEKCKVLNDYSVFVGKIKGKINEGKNIEIAVDEAVNESIEEDILSDYLLKHKSEVKEMCLTEFDEKEYIEFLRKEEREEGKKEGREEGRAEGKIETILSLVRDGLLSNTEGAKRLGFDLKKFNMML